MKRAMIHIGSGKTGTTSIQNSAALMEKESGCADLTYPLVTKNGHQSLEVLFKEYERVSRGLKSKFDNDNSYRLFKKDFEDSFNHSLISAANVFLSSEFMFEFKGDEVLRLREYLEDRGFKSFLIVLYLREPASFYLSYTQQKLKGSSKIYSPFDFETGYKKRVKRWVSVFGKESVVVKEYDKSKLYGGSVLKDIERLVNQYFDTSVSFPDVSSNKSLTAEGMAILQRFRSDYLKEYENRFTVESNLLIRRLSGKVLAGLGSSPRLKEKYESLLRHNNNADMLYLKKEFSVFKDFQEEGGVFSNQNDFSGNIADLLEDFDDDIYLKLLFDLVYEGVKAESKL